MLLERISRMWTALYEPDADVRAVIEQYFHPNYEQCINGVLLKRDEYIDHVITQKNAVHIEGIHYKHSIENGNELLSLYYPKGKDVKGKPILAEVIAYFKFEHDLIITIHGSVRMIEGTPADVDMTN